MKTKGRNKKKGKEKKKSERERERERKKRRKEEKKERRAAELTRYATAVRHGIRRVDIPSERRFARE
jgi:hypothetical protein